MNVKDIHVNETCVIIGNGPSLNDCPGELLDKYITFGSNKIYLLPYTPDYYCIIDKKMLYDCRPFIVNRGWNAKRLMFLRAEACVHRYYPIYPVVLGGFSLDIDNFVIMGGTVTYAMMQIANYMGFSKMLLVGVDHFYPKAGKGQPGSSFIADGDDPDHFETHIKQPYFTPGISYNRPELEGTTQSYKWAREYLDSVGKECVNLTPGSKLDVFKRGNYKDYI